MPSWTTTTEIAAAINPSNDASDASLHGFPPNRAAVICGVSPSISAPRRAEEAGMRRTRITVA